MRLSLTHLAPFFKKISIGSLRWLLGLFLAILVNQIPLNYFESYLFDLRMRIRPTPTISSLIELVYIDAETVQATHGIPSLKDHILFLENIKKQNPKSIVYLINPTTLIGKVEDQYRFAELASSINSFYVLTDELSMRGEVGKFDLPGVFKGIKVLSGPLTSDSKILAQDGVTRRMMLTYQGNILLHPYIASQIIPDRAIPSNIRGSFEFYDSEQSFIDMAPSDSFPHSKFIDILNEKKENNRFQGKIIFIGTNLGQSTKEYVRTPYSRQVTAMTALEAHANILNSLIQNSGVQSAPFWFNFLILLLVVILSVEVVLAMRPVVGLIVLGLTLSTFCIVSYIAFWPFGYWINIAQPLLGGFVAYYFLIPYRLIIENRRSWELIQKNRLLTQVEELKTNFIGMMSHDLKTPLVRIQGMVEMVFRDTNELSNVQKESLKTIQASTEDLLNLLSSILSFSRLESEGMQLHLKNKDVNLLVEEVVNKLTYLLNEKRIKIELDLEPLFNIRIDPDLIRQVIFNLIENAIKYSPSDTKIIVKTFEVDRKVFIKIIDEGVGVPMDEIPLLFMKFFRSRNAKSSSVKGSGLGLYLSRYFVELHEGQLTVTSLESKGSTFTIELPIKD